MTVHRDLGCGRDFVFFGSGWRMDTNRYRSEMNGADLVAGVDGDRRCGFLALALSNRRRSRKNERHRKKDREK